MEKRRGKEKGKLVRGKDLEVIVKAVVHSVCQQYPTLEWDDMESQAWLVITEKLDQYDPSRAALSTYLYTVIKGHLQMYAQRVILRGNFMNGLRDHPEELEAVSRDIQPSCEARLIIEKIYLEADPTKRKILKCMLDGLNQSETAKKLGLSKQFISQQLQEIRERYV